MTSVDVVVPCYNYGQFLRNCVASVLEQEGVHVRVLIIDDCSPDNTREIGLRLAAEDSRVQFRRHDVNRGHIATYNEGLLQWVSAPYCMILSADDLLAPGALARATAVMSGRPSIGMTYGCHLDFSDALSIPSMTASSADEMFAVLRPQQLLEFACRRGATEIASPTVVVRSEVQQQIGGYLEALPHSADTEMWLRFARYSEVAALRSVQAYKREHACNMASTAFAGVPGLLQQLSAVERHLEGDPSRSRECDKHRLTLRRTIAEQIAWRAMMAFEAGRVAEAGNHLRTARDIYPRLPAWQYRWRMQLKRAVGTQVWAAARRLVRSQRSTTDGPPIPSASPIPSKKATPVVSFVIPCYRLGHLLSACVTSILSQSYQNCEVIIMDDCSPDETATVAASFRDPRVRYVCNATNLGHLSNYNKGIGLARGAYVWLISADDRLRRPYLVEQYVRVMDANPAVGYACCPGVILDGDLETRIEGRVGSRDAIVDGRAFLTTLLKGNCVIAASGMVRRTCYERLGAFPLDLPYAGDWFLWCLFALHYDVAYFAEPMVNYRAHELSMTNHLMASRSRLTLQEGFAVLWRIHREAKRIGAANIAEECAVRLAHLYGRHLVGWTDDGRLYQMSEDEFEESLRSEGDHDAERDWFRARVWMAAGDCSVRLLRPKDARQHYSRAAEYAPGVPGLRRRDLFLKTGSMAFTFATALRGIRRTLRSRRAHAS